MVTGDLLTNEMVVLGVLREGDTASFFGVYQVLLRNFHSASCQTSKKDGAVDP